MAKKSYFSQIQAKIDGLQRERKQVLEHLTLVEDKLNKLQAPFQREITPNGTSRDEGKTKPRIYR